MRADLVLSLVVAALHCQAQQDPPGAGAWASLAKDLRNLRIQCAAIITKQGIRRTEYASILREYEVMVARPNKLAWEQNKRLMRENNSLGEENKRLMIQAKDILTRQKDMLEELESMNDTSNTQFGPPADVLVPPQMPAARDCAELYALGVSQDGVYTIHPQGEAANSPVDVWCDMTTDGGGWTTFLRRDLNLPHQDFDRDWQDYEDGFGLASEEYWLGLESLHWVTDRCTHRLRVHAADLQGEERWAVWGDCRVADFQTKFELSLGNYDATSTLGAFLNPPPHVMNQASFSTRDRDHDTRANENCAEVQGGGGGWWYKSCSFILPTAPHAAPGAPPSIQGQLSTFFWNPRRLPPPVTLSRLLFMVRPDHFPTPCT